MNGHKIAAVFIGILFAACICNGQVPQPSAGTFTPVRIDGPGTYQPNQVFLPYPGYGQVPVSQEIINNNNAEAMRRMGSNPPPTQEDIQRGLMMKARGHYALRMQQSEVEKILNEVKNDEAARNFKGDYYSSPEFISAQKSFLDAYNRISDMLKGKTRLSVRSAFYSAEAAYGNAYLSRGEYDRIITESAAFVKAWLIQNGYDTGNGDHLHFGIQKFLSDTLTITVNPKPDSKSPAKKVTHYPFGYDYDDYKGVKDHRNYFMTKTLATGYGQCDGLPDVYIAIAEALGAKVYMSILPFHSLVAYPDNNGTLQYYEATSNWKLSAKWYKDHFFISARAIETGIYLDTLNKEMMVANSLLDLAFAYLVKFGAGDGKFISGCINTAMAYYPEKNNIRAYFLRGSVLASHLHQLLKKHGIKNLSEIDKIPGARQLYDAIRENEAMIKSLGYQEMPEKMYEEIMSQQEFKGRIQGQKNINGKQKRTLFVQQ
jgi:hypothetical protein